MTANRERYQFVLREPLVELCRDALGGTGTSARC